MAAWSMLPSGSRRCEALWSHDTGPWFFNNQSFQLVQSIQLDFSRSLDSVKSNEANKSAMLCAEWTITERQAVLSLA